MKFRGGCLSRFMCRFDSGSFRIFDFFVVVLPSVSLSMCGCGWAFICAWTNGGRFLAV